jgi:hypothetical protein
MDRMKRHCDGWRKISLDPVPEGQPMKRVVLDGYLNPVPKPAPKVTPAPRTIYDEPWMRRILDMTKKGE